LCQVKYNFYDDVAAVNDSGFSFWVIELGEGASINYLTKKLLTELWRSLVFSFEVKALKNVEYLTKSLV
jgi:hypothetical protein